MLNKILNIKRKSTFLFQEDIIYFLNSKFSNLEFFLSKHNKSVSKKKNENEVNMLQELCREISLYKDSHNQTNVLKDLILEKIRQKGGFVNTHSHLDRAYTITPETLYLANAPLKEKWGLVDEIKRNSTVFQIYDRMAYALEYMKEQGVQAVGSFIDADEVIKDKSMTAAEMIKSDFSRDIKIKFINQTLKGVISPEARKWFDYCAEFADIIGGLPAKDAGMEDVHLDILMEKASKMGKPLHVHVDQFNTACEKETELLIKKTVEHNMQGRVTAIHSISLSAQPIDYRQQIYRQMKKENINLITCPTAWIDGKRSEELAPIHNSIAPIEELCEYGVNVGIGTDNIADIIKPFTDGNMWTELRFLLESCRFYNIEKLVDISTVNGLKILDIQPEELF
jgi:cytosine/creatinine deaminase